MKKKGIHYAFTKNSHLYIRLGILVKIISGGIKMIELTKDNFDSEVLEGEGYVFVDFWSQGCEPCKALMPEVHKLAEQYGDKIKFCSMDITKARRLAIKQKVLGLPTMTIYKGGEKVDEITKDDAEIAKIEAMIKKFY